MVRRLGLVALLVLAAMLTIFGCTDGTLDDQAELVTGGGDAPSLRLTALAPTTDTALDTVEVQIVPAEGGFDVAVKTTVVGIDTRELFFKLEYDPVLNHAIGVNTVVTSEKSGMIGMAIESAPGVIDFGVAEVDTSNAPAELTTEITSDDKLAVGDTLLGFKLVVGAADRTASAVANSNMSRARNLNMMQDDAGNWILSWDYTNPGDNNQDGMVTISDLTEIAVNWNALVDNRWEDPLRHLDTNGDGMVNISDITTIAQNYNGEIFAYQIEMWDEGQAQFIVVGQFQMADQEILPGQTYRFDYTFGAQYVPGAWYRIMPLDTNLEFGAPSEEISEQGRRMEAVAVETGGTTTVTISVHDLPRSITNVNACRVVYPNNFTYVTDSFNPGNIGGKRDNVDGIWDGFTSILMLAPESLIMETDLGNGYKACDFNVTVIKPSLPGSPVGFGDLFNFQLEADSPGELELSFQEMSEEGIKRTYYSIADFSEHYFGNTLGFSLQ